MMTRTSIEQWLDLVGYEVALERVGFKSFVFLHYPSEMGLMTLHVTLFELSYKGSNTR